MRILLCDQPMSLMVFHKGPGTTELHCTIRYRLNCHGTILQNPRICSSAKRCRITCNRMLVPSHKLQQRNLNTLLNYKSQDSTGWSHEGQNGIKLLQFWCADILIVVHLQPFCFSPLFLLSLLLTKIYVGKEKIEWVHPPGGTGICPFGNTHKVGVLDYNCVAILLAVYNERITAGQLQDKAARIISCVCDINVFKLKSSFK